MSGSAILLETTVTGTQELAGRTSPKNVAAWMEARGWYWRELRGFQEERVDDHCVVYRGKDESAWVTLRMKTFNTRQIHRGEAMDIERRIEQGIAI